MATIDSAGTVPVPSASLVLIIAPYNRVFNTTVTPHSFSFIFANDWFLDRLRTTVYVTGDAIATSMVSHLAVGADTATESAKEENNSSITKQDDDGDDDCSCVRERMSLHHHPLSLLLK